MAMYFGFDFFAGYAFTTAFAPLIALVVHVLDQESASLAFAMRTSHGPMPCKSILNSALVPVAAKAARARPSNAHNARMTA